MKSSTRFAILLFVVTAIFMGGLTWWKYQKRTPTELLELGGDEAPTLVDVAWTDLQEVQPFQLTERSGELFDSKTLDGKVWVASFFFARCPTICVQQNERIKNLRSQLKDLDVTFVSLTVDPEHDTPERLDEYAKRFTDDSNSWLFMTGELADIERIGDASFDVPVGFGNEKATHTTKLMVVDRWGRFRDAFDWSEPADLDRMKAVLIELVKETEPPRDETITTGNLMASVKRPANSASPLMYDHGPWQEQEWIEDFTLTERSGDLFQSKEMLGKVWVGSFFFASCPSICRIQNGHVHSLAENLKDEDVTFVSISTDPENDTPEKLQAYAKLFEADPLKWKFLTGDKLHVQRIGSEFFHVHAGKEDHSTDLVLIDKWGKIRGSYNWKKSEDLFALRKKAIELVAENEPPEASDDDVEPQTIELEGDVFDSPAANKPVEGR